MGNNFQDLGVKNREAVSPPTYRDKYQFLNEPETSDDEKEGGLITILNQNSIADMTSSQMKRDAVTTATTFKVS